MEKYQICSLQCLDGNDDVIEYPEGKVRFNKDTKWPRPSQMLASKQGKALQASCYTRCTARCYIVGFPNLLFGTFLLGGEPD